MLERNRRITAAIKIVHALDRSNIVGTIHSVQKCRRCTLSAPDEDEIHLDKDIHLGLWESLANRTKPYSSSFTALLNHTFSTAASIRRISKSNVTPSEMERHRLLLDYFSLIYMIATTSGSPDFQDSLHVLADLWIPIVNESHELFLKECRGISHVKVLRSFSFSDGKTDIRAGAHREEWLETLFQFMKRDVSTDYPHIHSVYPEVAAKMKELQECFVQGLASTEPT